MSNPTSSKTKYRCECQKEIIHASELRNHIKKPAIHKLKQIKTHHKKIKNFNKILERLKVIKYSQIFYFATVYSFYLSASKLAEIINIKSIKCFYATKIPLNYMKNKISQRHLNNQIKIFFLRLNPKLQTIFSLEKKQFRSNFNKFLNHHAHFTPTSLSVSIHKQFFITAGYDGRLRIWSLLNLLQLSCLTFHTSIINSIDIDKTSNYCLSGSDDTSICLWNLKKLKIHTVFYANQNEVTSVKFSKNSSFFLSGSSDCAIRIWNTFQKTLLYSIKTDSSVQFVSFLNNFQGILFVDKSIKKISFKNSGHYTRNNLKAISFTLTEKAVISGLENGFIQVFYAETLKLLKTWKAHSGKVQLIDYCKIDQLIASGSHDQTIKLWNSSTYQIIKQFKTQKSIKCIKITSKIVFSVDLFYKISLFQANTNSEKTIYSLKVFASLSVCVKRQLIVYGFEMIYLYDMKSKKHICNKNFNSAITSLAFVGSIILCGVFLGYIYLVDCYNLKVKRHFVFGKEPIVLVRALSDWKVIAYSSPNKLEVRDLKTSSKLFTHNVCVHEGRFNQNLFFFIDKANFVYILKDFMIVSKINHLNCFQLFCLKTRDYLMLKENSSKLILIDLRSGKAVEKVKSLKDCRSRQEKTALTMRKSYLILSSLNYSFVMN